MNETTNEQAAPKMIGGYTHEQILGACDAIGVDPSEISLYSGGEGCCTLCDKVANNPITANLSKNTELLYQVETAGLSPIIGAKYKPASQKAIGVLKLGVSGQAETELASETMVYVSGVGKFFTARGGETVMPPLPFFARPCPMRPRHGFVDSRVINDETEWEALLSDIANCDEPECEVLLMRPVSASSSAIVSSGGVTLGPSNDGATSGHNALTIPSVAEGLAYAVSGYTDDDFGVKDRAYLEYVFDEKTHLVQVRDGPRASLSPRFIPAEVTVTNVIEAGGDLMDWEATIDALPKGGGGTVIHHPGGSMASHYAVHCVLRDIPVICEDEAPKVGDVLEPTGDSFKPSEDNLKQFKAAFNAGWATFDSPPKSGELYLTPDLEAALNFGIGSIHSWGAWSQAGFSEAQMNMLGYGTAALLRVSAWSINGECRHYSSSGPGRGAAGSAVKRGHLTLYPSALNEVAPVGGSRLDAYRAVGGLSAVELYGVCARARVDFEGDTELYNNGWGSSFGGKKWGLCTDATLRALESVALAMTSDDPQAMVDVISAMNGIINSAHNGGFFLNKFVGNHLFNRFATCPALAFISPRAYDVASGGHTGAPDDWASVVKVDRKEVVKQAMDGASGRQLAKARERWREINESDIVDAVKDFSVDPYYWHEQVSDVLGITVDIPEPDEPAVEVEVVAHKAEKVGAPKVAAEPEPESNTGWTMLVGLELNAQYQVRGQTLKVQAATSKVNRKYGLTFQSNVLDGDLSALAKKWGECDERLQSLALTKEMYAPCVLTVNAHGKMTVKVDGCDPVAIEINAKYLVNQ